jgi:hypothetical protein
MDKTILSKLGLSELPKEVIVESVDDSIINAAKVYCELGIMHTLPKSNSEYRSFVYPAKRMLEIETGRRRILEALIGVLKDNHSYVFDDDYVVPEDSGITPEIVINIIEEQIGKTWEYIKEALK